MIAMRTKPESKLQQVSKVVKPESLMKKAMAKAFEVPWYVDMLCDDGKVRPIIISTQALPVYKDIEQVKIELPQSNIIDFPTNEQAVNTKEDGVSDDTAALQSWLYSFAHFNHDPSLTRTEKKSVVRADGTIGVHRTVINKVFATFLMDGDHWGSYNPDGSERFDADYPTRAEAIRRSGLAAFHRKKWPHGEVINTLPEGWKMPRPSLLNVIYQYWDDIEKTANTKVDAKNHNRMTIALHTRDASWWGPTAIVMNREADKFVNTMAKQYRLEYDEHIREFEKLNAINDDRYASIVDPDTITRIPLEVYDLLERSVGGWIEVGRNTPLLPPPAKANPLVENELARLNQIALNSWFIRNCGRTLDSHGLWLKGFSEFCDNNRRMSRIAQAIREWDEDTKERMLLRKGQRALAQIRGVVYRVFDRPKAFDDEARWFFWWKAIIATEGYHPEDAYKRSGNPSELVTTPTLDVVLRQDEFDNSLIYWNAMVNMGKAPRSALMNAVKRVHRARRLKASTPLITRIEPTINDTPIEDVVVSEVVSTGYSQEEVLESVQEDLYKLRSSSVSHLVNDPAFNEDNDLRRLLKIHDTRDNDFVTVAIKEGYFDVGKLTDWYARDTLSPAGLMLPKKMLEVSPAEWARDVGVHQPRKTLWGTLKDKLHIGTEK